jgi:predicted GIY-YIG superfamily endonuclease
MKIYYYIIRCLDESITDCYVGQTLNIKNRIREHKSRSNNPNDASYNKRLYRFIRQHGGFDNWTIEMIDSINLYDKSTALAFEQSFIIFHSSTLNSNLAY